MLGDDSNNSCRCPDGYRMGKLECKHAELVASKWPYRSSENKLDWIMELIKKFLSVAAFHKKDPSQPVAWILQYGHCGMGNLFTVETHRRQGLGLAAAAALSQEMFAECPDIPVQCLIAKGNTASVNLFKKLGFVHSKFYPCFYSVEKN